MAEKINDGGPAYPHCFEDIEGHPNWGQSQGMSLRDWFAGQASEADIERHSNFWRGDTHIMRTREEAKYAYADAMLATRSSSMRREA